MEDLEFSGIIYDFDHPEAPESGTWYHLTPEDMLSMPSLVGLPIRVEHEEDIDVGEIVSCSVVNGKACVRGRLKDGPRGWAAKQLMRTKDIKELSLRHAEFVRPADGKVVHRVPIEVSLVAKGARPGSIITASKTSSPYLLLLSRHIKAGAASAPHAMDAGAPPQAAAVPQAVAAPVPAAVAGGEAATATNNALAAGLAAAVPTNVTADEPEAKRARTEDNAHVTFAQAIAAKVADPDTLHSILNYVAQNMEQSVATESELVKFSEEKQAMQKKEQAMKDTNKTQVMEAVNVINNLYKHIVPNMNVSDAARESFTDMLISNAALKPEIIEFLRPMSVAASAIAAQQQKAETTNKEVELRRPWTTLPGCLKSLWRRATWAPPPRCTPTGSSSSSRLRRLLRRQCRPRRGRWRRRRWWTWQPPARPARSRCRLRCRAFFRTATPGANRSVNCDTIPSEADCILCLPSRMRLMPGDFSNSVTAMRSNGGAPM
jgi:hypothetical protein